ncbi:MAG: hypothetical protein IPP27_02205 [Bacteroidetes bacterium]|nr:hypothetical protein [Bacteroidota bacterium]MBP6532971.1 hypothetical protein [Bacteroidia bacterium]
MVKGLDVFKKYFEEFPDNYVVIGGTACDIILVDAGFTARATKDIDIILVVEALKPDFVKQFWQFIKVGKYELKEIVEERNCYRFSKPENDEFPFQIELFSKKPDIIALDEDVHLTPIPVEEGVSSLSAILMNEDYYKYVIDNSILENGIHRAKTEALICLKAKAYLEITARIAEGSTEDSKQLRKHKNDVFRLAAMLTANDTFELPENIHSDLREFTESIAKELPGKEMFKEAGLGNLEPENVFKQILNSFQLSEK